MTSRPRLALTAAACLIAAAASAAAAPLDAATRQLSHDILKELIEINTTDSSGNTTLAAKAMRRRLLEAGFPAADLVVLGANARKGNLVARYRGRPGSALRPVLIIGHLDVVEAHREDWSTDPFRLVEQDGYFYGRGTEDMKGPDAIAVTTFIRLRRAGYVPDRDIILALTADEESGTANGVDWLLKNHRELVDAEFVLNPDAGEVRTDKGRPIALQFEATEKLYADYQLLATSPGGHSSRPTADNAIYRVADALQALQKHPFPLDLNPVTRAYFEQMAALETPAAAADIRAILATPPDAAAVARLAQDPHYNATMRTTCIPTLISGGHAVNAQPQRAEANVNCRIVPGHSQEEVRLELVGVFGDPALKVRYRSDNGDLNDRGSMRVAMAPPPPRADLMRALGAVTARLWPGIPLIPFMETTATDSIYTMAAGMPSYGVNGIALDFDDKREHGRDERIRVQSFDDGVVFYYEFLRELTDGGQIGAH